MSLSVTASLPAQVLTPRLYFNGLVVVCTVTLGATLAIQSLGDMAVTELARFQQLSFAAVILLASLGVLLGAASQRGWRGQGIVALCALALVANFVVAGLLIGVSLSPASTAAPVDVWLAGWNGSVALGLGIVSLGILMRWRHG